MSSGVPFIRTATEADRPELIALINAAFVVESFLEGTRTDEQRLSALMTKGTFLLAFSKPGQLVASVYLEDRGGRSYLGMLAVDPQSQGQGLGTLIVKAAEDYCREQGSNAMDLTVLSLRAELLSFYQKLGYSEAGIEEFRPSRPLKAGVECHCIRMSKEL